MLHLTVSAVYVGFYMRKKLLNQKCGLNVICVTIGYIVHALECLRLLHLRLRIVLFVKSVFISIKI